MNLERALQATARAIYLDGTRFVDLREPEGWQYQMLVLVDPHERARVVAGIEKPS